MSWVPSERQQERDAYRRSRAQRSTAVAVLSTIALVAVAVLALTSSPGWPRVKASFFDWEVAQESFPAILQGLWLNIRVMAVSAVLIVIVAMGLALARTLRGPVFFPVRALATGYVDVFRGLPLILVLLLVGFGLPGLRLQGIPTSAVALGTLALVLTYSAYVAEVFRAGIESVHPSQVAAARSLGLTRAQAMQHVVLPQAVRRVIPPLLNDAIGLMKDTALVSFLGPVESFRRSQIFASADFNYTPYLVSAMLFLLLTIPLARLVDWLVARDRQRYLAGAR